MKIGIRGKLFAISLLLIAVVGLTSGAFLESRLRSELTVRIEDDLLRRTETAKVAVSLLDQRDAAAFDRLADELGRHGQAEVTIIGADGTWLGDSSGDPTGRTKLTAEGQPTEMVDALRHGVGTARRRDEASRAQVLYVAAAFPSAEQPQGVIRFALPLSEVSAAISELRALMLLAALVGLVTATFMSGVASELMARTLRTFVDNAVSLVRGERSEKIPLISRDEIGRLAGSFNQVASELQGAVADLASERARLQTILECMGEAVITLDERKRVTLANSAAERLLGLDEGDMGKPLLEAVRLPALSEAVDGLREGENEPIEFELPQPPHRRVMAYAAPLKMVGGSVIVLHDMTEIRKLERMRRDFVANVSHELRTPIAVIRANTETLLNGALEEEGPHRHRFVDGIHRNADRLNQLIADLLDLSKIEAGQYKLNLEPVDLDESVETVLDSLEAKAQDRGVKLMSELEGDELVLADPTALEQILTNFLDNAIKYAPKDGNVWIRADVEDDFVRIEVQDDGPGIEPTHRKRVFERFYRVDKGRARDVGGTGLGLSICKHLADAMNGGVGCDAAPNRGSIFWVRLPKGEAEVQERVVAAQ